VNQIAIKTDTCMANRRTVLRIAVCSLASAMVPAWAQQPGKVPVVGLLMLTAGPNDPIVETLRRELDALGYVEGQNIRIEHRSAAGEVDRLPSLAEELVALRVDAIVVGGASIARVAKQATATIPIVMIAWDYDPVAAGLVDSLSRPGGNITGVSPQAPELVGKCLDLLRELLPGLSRMAVFYDVFGKRQVERLEVAARRLGIHLQLVEFRAPYDYSAAFKNATKRKAQAVMRMSSPHFHMDRELFAKLALEYKLPTIFLSDPTVRVGGLISYGASLNATFGRAAYYIDRVLKGARPSELPIEQPDVYRLVINLKTAKALNLAVPQSILQRADEMIP